MDNPLEARSPRSPPPNSTTKLLARSLRSQPRSCSLWAALAQEELYRHVGLRDGAAAKLFLATIRAGSSGGFRVHSFRLLVTEVAGHPLRSWLQKPVRLSQVKELLKISPKLRGLRIVGETEDPVFNLSVLSALIAEGLEDLTFTLCDFMPSPSASPLFSSRLRRLTLFLLTDPADLAPILAWADLPQLEALIIVNGFLPLTSEDTNALEKALLRYSARLKSFPLSFGPATKGGT
ncbi:hypothetical protein BCR35DRAFT_348920 [Leucosporidium creatinivorum]|uniref:F-box domain-containing protein n=1 Tax=Leucosporidium creatinivorum TaxID=106004 RepID=A0A1Y2G3L2_9BASI|nr:hypothetical protein BCR35DRAFT_348920 [Leucosporidium creatinivorum]